MASSSTAGEASSSCSEVSPTWIFSKEDMLKAASVRDGMTVDQELEQRQKATRFIQVLVDKLNFNIRDQRGKMSGHCTCAAMIHMHRFFYFHSFKFFDYRDVGAACVFMCGKAEESPRKLEHTVRSWWSLKFPGIKIDQEKFDNGCQLIVMLESLLLQTIVFDLKVQLPHPHVITLLTKMKDGIFGQDSIRHRKISEVAYFFATDVLCVTSWGIRYTAAQIATACVYIICSWAGHELPRFIEGSNWYQLAHPDMTMAHLDEMSNDFTAIYKNTRDQLALKKFVEKYGCSPSSPSTSTSVVVKGDIREPSHIRDTLMSSTPSSSSSTQPLVTLPPPPAPPPLMVANHTQPHHHSGSGSNHQKQRIDMNVYKERQRQQQQQQASSQSSQQSSQQQQHAQQAHGTNGHYGGNGHSSSSQPHSSSSSHHGSSSSQQPQPQHYNSAGGRDGRQSHGQGHHSSSSHHGSSSQTQQPPRRNFMPDFSSSRMEQPVTLANVVLPNQQTAPHYTSADRHHSASAATASSSSTSMPPPLMSSFVSASAKAAQPSSSNTQHNATQPSDSENRRASQPQQQQQYSRPDDEERRRRLQHMDAERDRERRKREHSQSSLPFPTGEKRHRGPEDGSRRSYPSSMSGGGGQGVAPQPPPSTGQAPMSTHPYATAPPSYQQHHQQQQQQQYHHQSTMYPPPPPPHAPPVQQQTHGYYAQGGGGRDAHAMYAQQQQHKSNKYSVPPPPPPEHHQHHHIHPHHRPTPPPPPPPPPPPADLEDGELT